MPGAASDPLSVGFGEMMRDVPLGDDASASTVACEGWLWKGGWLNPAFRRRFFTLRGSEISYMTDRESKQLRGKFNALSARPVVSTGRYRFSVQSDSGRVYLLESESDFDRQTWLRALAFGLRSASQEHAAAEKAAAEKAAEKAAAALAAAAEASQSGKWRASSSDPAPVDAAAGSEPGLVAVLTALGSVHHGAIERSIGAAFSAWCGRCDSAVEIRSRADLDRSRSDHETAAEEARQPEEAYLLQVYPRERAYGTRGLASGARDAPSGLVQSVDVSVLHARLAERRAGSGGDEAGAGLGSDAHVVAIDAGVHVTVVFAAGRAELRLRRGAWRSANLDLEGSPLTISALVRIEYDVAGMRLAANLLDRPRVAWGVMLRHFFSASDAPPTPGYDAGDTERAAAEAEAEAAVAAEAAAEAAAQRGLVLAEDLTDALSEFLWRSCRAASCAGGDGSGGGGAPLVIDLAPPPPPAPAAAAPAAEPAEAAAPTSVKSARISLAGADALSRARGAASSKTVPAPPPAAEADAEAEYTKPDDAPADRAPDAAQDAAPPDPAPPSDSAPPPDSARLSVESGVTESVRWSRDEDGGEHEGGWGRAEQARPRASRGLQDGSDDGGLGF